MTGMAEVLAVSVILVALLVVAAVLAVVALIMVLTAVVSWGLLLVSKIDQWRNR